MKEYIVQYERKKEVDNPTDKCDLCDHAIVGEIVRCKDCVNFDYDFNYCNYLEAGVDGEDFFCSCGEGRET